MGTSSQSPKLDSINESFSIVGNSSEYLDDVHFSAGILFKLCSYIFIVMGTLAALMNFSVFSILSQKKKKVASELLVLTNLIIDGSYGLLLVLTGVMNVADVNLSRLLGLDSISCIVIKVPSTFLVFASLFLVLIIAFNRFMAVKYPISYKNVFRLKMIRLYLSGLFLVSGAFASIDIGICVGDPFEQSDFAIYYSWIWIYVKFFLVIIAALSVFVVYKFIAGRFARSFWSPVKTPFKYILTCCATIQDESPPTANQNASDTDADRSFANEEEGDEEDEGYAMTRRNSDVTETRMTKVSITRDQDSNDMLSANGGDEIVPMKKADKLQPPVLTKKKARKTMSTQHQSKHYVTTVLFLVSCTFLAVSIPSSVSHIVNHLLQDSIPMRLQFNLYLMTETLYGVNFVLNPYLFSFNNSYLKERLRQHPFLARFRHTLGNP